MECMVQHSGFEIFHLMLWDMTASLVKRQHMSLEQKKKSVIILSHQLHPESISHLLAMRLQTGLWSAVSLDLPKEIFQTNCDSD